MLAFVRTGATPKKGKSRYWRNGTIPWVTSGSTRGLVVNSATDFVTSAALNETNLTIFPPGTLLIAMYGEGKTRGSCAELEIPATTNQAIAALVTESFSDEVKDWLKLFFHYNYRQIRRRAAGGVQPNLNLGIIKSIPIPLPPLVEMDQAVSKAELAESVESKLTQTILAGNSRIANLLRSVLKNAFEGKLVDQDPNDEPAAELLERIKSGQAELPFTIEFER